jgi:hypothetical protein
VSFRGFFFLFIPFLRFFSFPLLCTVNRNEMK